MSMSTILRTAKEYRIRAVHIPFTMEDWFAEDSTTRIVRVYNWESRGRGWQLIYGKRGVKATHTADYNGYSQGEHLRILHNNADKEWLDLMFDYWIGNNYEAVVDHWDPEPGVGWTPEDYYGEFTTREVWTEEKLIQNIVDSGGEKYIDPKYIEKLDLGYVNIAYKW